MVSPLSDRELKQLLTPTGKLSKRQLKAMQKQQAREQQRQAKLLKRQKGGKWKGTAGPDPTAGKPKKRGFLRRTAGRLKVMLLAGIIFAIVLIPTVIDPLTPGVEETEIIVDQMMRAYNYVFGEDIVDEDRDGVDDGLETSGWLVDREVLHLGTSGANGSFAFALPLAGNYALTLSYRAPVQAQLGVMINGVEELEFGLGPAEWVRLNVGTLAFPAGDQTLRLVLVNGTGVQVDWLQLRTGDFRYSWGGRDCVAGAVVPASVRITTSTSDPDSDGDGMLDGYEMLAQQRHGLQHPWITNQRYALLLVGGGDEDGGEEQNYPAFWNNLARMHDTLTDYYNYDPTHITTLFWSGSHSTRSELIDGSLRLWQIDHHLGRIRDNLTRNDLFLIYISAHGASEGGFRIYSGDDSREIYSYQRLSEYFDAHLMEGDEPIFGELVTLIDVCYGGTALDAGLGGVDRVIISASEADEPGTTVTTDGAGTVFSFHMITNLRNPNLQNVPTLENIRKLDFEFEDRMLVSLQEAYNRARESTLVATINNQHPVVDGDGDNTPDSSAQPLTEATFL